MTKGGAVYIMTNVLKSVLYTGVTSDLISRVQEHKTKAHPESFTAKYNATILIYRNFLTIDEAILEEKRIKAGSRKQKCVLINSINPNWKDLWEEVGKW